jgi:hypothetical protein
MIPTFNALGNRELHMVLLALKAAGLVSYLSVGLWLLIRLLREKYAASVQVIWYLFTLAFHLSLLFLWWASAILAIDPSGKPNGATGAFAMELMTAMLDLKTDLQVMGALASLVVVPQIASYMLSALFGCASRPRLVAVTAEWLSWGVTKSFAMTSAILAAITVWGSTTGWHGLDQNAVLRFLLISSMLILLSFALLLIKYQIAEIPSLAERHSSSAIAAKVLRLHRWATRHRKDLNDSSLMDQHQAISNLTKVLP